MDDRRHEQGEGRPGAETLGTPADEMLSLLAHELRNPLAAIEGWARIAADARLKRDEDTLTTAMKGLDHGINRLRSLVTSIADSGSIAEECLLLDLKEVLISSLVEEVVSDLELFVRDHELSVRVEDDTLIQVDADRIRQVLVNLVSNAVKFSKRGSEIQITISVVGSTVAICVNDEGRGVAEDREDELFQKFSRLGATEDGTGLGLYISRAIARSHGGDLKLESKDAPGCRFKLTLPLS